MRLRNTSDRFGALAKAFHWLTLALLIGSFTLAYSMVDLPFSPRMLQLYSWHKWVGVTVFLVVVLRLCWRLANPVPRPPGSVGRGQRILARLSHAGLYAILIVMPTVGWVMSSALNLPVVYLGLVYLPSPFGVDEPLGEALRLVHRYLSYALLALASGHALAALHHHFILRDGVMARMLPWPAARNGK